MITVSILPAIFIVLHSFLLIRFCLDFIFQTEDRPHSFPWLLFILLVPVIGYFNYHRRFVMKRKM
jgi:hypothetical protein